LVFTLLREARIGAVSEKASHRFLLCWKWVDVAGAWGCLLWSGLGLGLVLECRFFRSSHVPFWLISLSLLATVRGGTSFLCQTATKKRSKENALQPLILKCRERAASTVWFLRKTLGA
jgi:hypothetical protein